MKAGDELIGKKIYDGDSLESNNIIVSGIIETNYKYYTSNLDSLSEIENEHYQYMFNNLFFVYYVNNTYIINNRINELINSNYDDIEVQLSTDSKAVSNNLYTINYMDNYDYYNKDLITIGGLNPNLDSINENEIIITLDEYNSLFNKHYEASDYISVIDGIAILLDTPELGQHINLKVRKGNLFVELNQLKIIGIIVYRDEMINDIDYEYESEIIINKDEFYLLKDFKKNISGIQAVIHNYEDFKNFLKDNPVYKIDSVFSNDLYNYEMSLSYTKNNFLVTSIIMLFFSVLLIYNFIINNIKHQKKNIGILRSLGASNVDIIKIYIIEGFFIATIIAFVSMLTIMIWINIQNLYPPDYVLKGAILMRVNSLIIIESIFIPYLTIILAVIIPIIKISKMKPIDAIKNF